jgi:hypothetical protein
MCHSAPTTSVCTLALAVSSLLVSHEATTEPLLPGEGQLILALEPGESPEGLALGAGGIIYIANRFPTPAGLGSEILKLGKDGMPRKLIAFPATDDPNANGILGLALDKGNDDVYAALHTLDPETQGVWRIRKNGKLATRLPGSEQMAFPNALTFDDSGNLYVTDSTGSIWRFDPDGANEQGGLWVEHDLLEPFLDFDPVELPLPDGTLVPVELPGANGIAFVAPNKLYVGNTEKGLLVRVGINPDGSPQTPEAVAGNVENPYTPLLTVDGVTAGKDGRIHAVIAASIVLPIFGVQSSPLVEIDPVSGAVDLVVTDPDVIFGLFHVPLSLVRGVLPGTENTVFVANGALQAEDFPGPGPGIIQVGVGAAN